MKVITVTNQKGGTGKTSTALFLTYGLANRGKRVLLIDLDQQADASFAVHVGYDKHKTSFELLTDEINISEAITPVNEFVDLIPASARMARLDVVFATTEVVDAQFKLKDKLEEIQDDYDYIIIDTPPAISMAVLNALTASDEVVVPTQADIFSLKGFGELAAVVNQIKKRSNPSLKIAGILVGRYNSRTLFAQSVSDQLEKTAAMLHTKVFKSKIREATSVKESQNAFKSIFEYDPRGKVTQDINNFIDELMEG